VEQPEIAEQIRRRWIREREHHDRFRAVLCSSVQDALRSNGIPGHVTSRVKEVDSLVRKVMTQLKQGRSPTFESIVDKVGVRAVVRYREEVEEAANFLRGVLRCIKVEFKGEGKKLNEFGYESCHMDVALRPDHPEYSSFISLVGELQVRTSAQDLWADMAHELSYKSVLRDLIPPLQESIDRRIYILSALVESADMEFSRINNEILRAPGAEGLLLLRALEREYFKYTAKTYNPEFSLESITVLRTIDARSLAQLRQDLANFSQRNSAKLAHIFTDQASNQDRSVFLFQPESILIFECLERRPSALEEVWELNFPVKELERLAIVWGMPIF
jgi:ppGpp synthetase/RelA/SpoT-type nucleotidyltranferase